MLDGRPDREDEKWLKHLERAGLGEITAGTRKLRPASGKRSSQRPQPALSSVANSLRLIKAFPEDHYEIGHQRSRQALGLAKSTVHRLASTARSGMPSRTRVTPSTAWV